MDTATLITLIVGLAVVALPLGYGIKLILEARHGLREMDQINRRLFGLPGRPSDGDE